MNNDFKNNLKTENSNWDNFSQKEASNLILNTFINTYSNYNDISNSKEAQYYFHNMVAALMIEYHKHFPSYEVKANYRFKSQKSIIDKILEYMNREDKSDITKNNNDYNFLLKQIKDVFAMKIVLGNRPSSFHSNDDKINKLIEEKVSNQEALTLMQEFLSKLVSNDFSIDSTYSYNVTKKEYYKKCKELLTYIKGTIHESSTNLLLSYQELEEAIDLLLDSIESNELITEEDFPNGDINFQNLYNDFSSRIYDKLDLEILTRQIDSILKNSPILKRLGLTLNEFKEKRTPDGYVSNFMGINTPLGPIELQLQSMHEYREGNYGYAAHTQMKGKQIKGYKIPTSDDEKSLKQFRGFVKFISPKVYVCEFDDVEKNKVLIQGYSDYKNYRNIIGQVKEGSIKEKALFKYFDTLYSKRTKLFLSDGESFELIPYDINKYLDSPDFKKVTEKNSKIEDIEL